MRAIVVANGVLDNPAGLAARLADWAEAAVIAADGGLRNCRRLGLIPDTIVGDLDSVELAELESTEIRRLPSPREKEETDLELALLHAQQEGISQVLILAALGGRMDMTAANLLLLAHPRLAGLDIQLWSDGQTAWLLRPPGGGVSGRPGDLLSLIPLAGPALGVVTEGLQYPLRGETLAFGVPRGLSNLLTVPNAQVHLESGLLLVVHTHSPAGPEPSR